VCFFECNKDRVYQMLNPCRHKELRQCRLSALSTKGWLDAGSAVVSRYFSAKPTLAAILRKITACKAFVATSRQRRPCGMRS
jgi:hypothetical protein